MTEVDPEIARCPICRVGPGFPCVYIEPANRHVNRDRPSVKWLYDRVGKPTKVSHRERWVAARALYEGRRAKAQDDARLARMTAEGKATHGRAMAAWAAEQEFNRRAAKTLRDWLAEYGSILF